MAARVFRGRRRLASEARCRGCDGPAQPWEAVCGVCWSRLPQDLRGALAIARRARAPHRVAAAAKDARAWLHDHSPAASIAARLGEQA